VAPADLTLPSAPLPQVNRLLAEVSELSRQVEQLRGRPASPRPKQSISDAVSLDKKLNH
jgi:type II secretory pathway component PulM